MKKYALIVAGGKGTRMKSELPKQFIELAGLPVLMHTLQAFHRYSPDINIILVLPEADLDIWKSLCEKHKFHNPVVIQFGGFSRFQSVKNGLDKIEGDGLVAIHDGVRPLVTTDIIEASFQLASIQQTAVAAIPLKDSIRFTEQGNTKAVDRSSYRLIQTPQTFKISLIKQAYTMKEDASLSDDASVAEKAGHNISLFKGSYENIKITTPEDLIIAEALMKSRNTQRAIEHC